MMCKLPRRENNDVRFIVKMFAFHNGILTILLYYYTCAVWMIKSNHPTDQALKTYRKYTDMTCQDVKVSDCICGLL